MSTAKTRFLAAAAVGAVAVYAAPAQAQFAFPAAEIHGAGTSATANWIRQSADCYSLKQDLGFGVTGSTPQAAIGLREFDFDRPEPDTISNRFNCAGNSANPPLLPLPPAGSPAYANPRIVQPNIKLFYLSTGSGQGITAFLNGRVSSNIVVSAGFSAYDSADGYQYSASEVALSAGNITTYNNALINPFTRYAAADTAANLFGAAIQVPFAILPIAVAYAPVYAKVRDSSGFVSEYRFTVGSPRPDGSGGLRLTRAQYCGIFNGTITNWSQLPTSVVNKDVNDPAQFNVPISLVGFSDTSGTTSVFTRAMAAQCTGLSVANGVNGSGPLIAITNKFGDSENRLPYDGVTTVSGTAYTGAAGTISPTNSLSGAFFNKGTGVISVGTPAVGLFTVANGDDGVALATANHPDPSAIPGDRTLNGKIAYVSPEQTLPAALFSGANGLGLHTANLSVNTSNSFLSPSATNASLAFGTRPPPQSKGTAGAYCTDRALCPTAYGDRSNPLDWVQRADRSVAQADPVKGYPIIGTSNVLLYTCYATDARRQAVDGYFATIYGKVTKDHNNQAFPNWIFRNAQEGLFARNGLSLMPTAWATAITETFLKKSTQVGVVGNAATQLGLRNLWIQNRIPTTPTGPTSITLANPTCSGKPGA